MRYNLFLHEMSCQTTRDILAGTVLFLVSGFSVA
jgi:hypothetical protein